MNFEDLTKRISPKLNAIAHKLNGRYTFFNEDDLYQEALLNLWQKYNKGELSDKTDSYIIQGCFFFLKNYIRKIYKKIDINTIRLEDFIEDQDNTDNNSFENSFLLEDKTDEEDFVNTKLLTDYLFQQLSERERKILQFCLEGLTKREIGNKLGISHVMVMKIEKRIREKCKEFKKEIKE